MKICLYGFSDYGKIGNDAKLLSVLAMIKATFRDVEITVMGPSPDILAAHYGLKVADCRGFFDTIKILRQHDLLICNTGTVLSDKQSEKDLKKYLSVANLAKIFKRPVFILSQEFGEVKSERLRQKAVKVLRRTSKVTVNDEKSSKTLQSWGFRKGRIRISGSPLFLVDQVEREWNHRDAMTSQVLPEKNIAPVPNEGIGDDSLSLNIYTGEVLGMGPDESIIGETGQVTLEIDKTLTGEATELTEEITTETGAFSNETIVAPEEKWEAKEEKIVPLVPADSEGDTEVHLFIYSNVENNEPKQSVVFEEQAENPYAGKLSNVTIKIVGDIREELALEEIREEKRQKALEREAAIKRSAEQAEAERLAKEAAAKAQAEAEQAAGEESAVKAEANAQEKSAETKTFAVYDDEKQDRESENNGSVEDKICHSCQAVNSGFLEFCSVCGNPLAFEDKETEPVPAVENGAETESVVINPIKTCSNCGSLLPEGLDICTNCGHSRGEAPIVIEGNFIICPFCSRRNPKGNFFCDSCGGSLIGAATRLTKKEEIDWDTIPEGHPLLWKSENQKMVGVALGNLPQTIGADVAVLCDNLIRNGYKVVFIPLSYPEDLKTGDSIINTMEEYATQIRAELNVKEMLTVFDALDVVITNSATAVTIGAVNQIPFAVLADNREVIEVTESLGHFICGKITNFDSEKFYDNVNAVLNDADNFVATTMEYLPTLREKSAYAYAVLKTAARRRDRGR